MATSYGTATKSLGPPPIEIDDGSYPGHVADVEDTEGQFGLQYAVKWELDDEYLMDEDERGNQIPRLDDYGEPMRVALTQWVKIPKGLIQYGQLNIKSNLYKFIEGLGIKVSDPDPDAEVQIPIEPSTWIGKPALLLLVNETIKEGDRAGENRVVIRSVSQPRQRTQRRRPQQAEQGQGQRRQPPPQQQQEQGRQRQRQRPQAEEPSPPPPDDDDLPYD